MPSVSKKRSRAGMSSALISSSVVPTGIAALIAMFAFSRLNASKALESKDLEAKTVTAIFENIESIKAEISKIVTSDIFNKFTNRSKNLVRNLKQKSASNAETIDAIQTETKELLKILEFHNSKKTVSQTIAGV
jgi:hypothetical protein